MSRVFLSRYVPLSLLAMLGVFLLYFAFTHVDDYGRSVDEAIQDRSGHTALAWYQTHGKDTLFFTENPQTYMPQHGIIFDVFIAKIQDHLRLKSDTEGYWQVRALITGFAGLVGIAAIALCGYELGGWWLALLAALGLCLYPRFFGAMFNNPKDVPFTSAWILVMWAVLRLIKDWQYRYRFIPTSLLLAFLIGLAASIRVNAILWYPILAAMLGCWWLFHVGQVWRERKLMPTLLKSALATALIAGGSLLAMMAFWPYVSLNPLRNLYVSIKVMQKYPWDHTILFAGHVYRAMHLPWYYAPVWLAIGSPLPLLICATLGLLIICVLAFKKRVLDAKLVIVLISFIFPLVLIVGLHATLYDALRQFLFIVPGIILLAAYAVVTIFSILARRKQQAVAVALIVVLAGSYVLVAKETIDLHPMEYAYFSPIVGGIAGANNNYQVDYWHTCQRSAVEWLRSNYKRYTTKPHPVIRYNGFEYEYTMYLPPNVFVLNSQNADFFISVSVAPEPGFHSIYTVAREDVPMCAVMASNTAK